MLHHDKIKYINFKGNILKKILETENFKKYPFREYLYKHYILKHPLFTIDMINNYHKLYFIDKLSFNPNIDINIIKKYIDKLNFYPISINTNLNMDFINTYIDWFDIELLLTNPIINIEFIEKYIKKTNPDKILWDKISCNPNLTINFIEKNIKNIVWSLLSKNIYLSFELFDKYKNKLIENMPDLLLNPSLTYELTIKYKIPKKWENEIIPYTIKELHKYFAEDDVNNTNTNNINNINTINTNNTNNTNTINTININDLSINIVNNLNKHENNIEEIKILVRCIQEDPFINDEIIYLINHFPKLIDWNKILRNEYLYNNDVYTQTLNIDIKKKRTIIKNIFSNYINKDLYKLISSYCYYN